MKRYPVHWLAMAILLLDGSACQKDAGPVVEEEIIRPVRYQQVQSVGAFRERSFSGAARAGAQIALSFKVGGTVSELAVDRGDTIQQGDLIASLDPRDYELQVEDVQASLAQARAQARNAAADYDRVRSLYENNNASKDDLDAARTAAESAEASVRSVGKKLELAQLQLSYTRLTAPTDGSVAETRVEVNENVTAGNPIVMLTAGERPEVEVTVPESLIRQIYKNSSVGIHFDALPGETFRGIVTEVGVAPTRSATTFPVTVQLDRPEDRILPGMAAAVVFRFETANEGTRFVLPPQAVGEDREGRFVFVVEPQTESLGTVHRKTVKVGELVAEGLEVLEELRAGTG